MHIALKHQTNKQNEDKKTVCMSEGLKSKELL